jgi:uncharacterized protein (DUF1499 family)
MNQPNTDPAAPASNPVTPPASRFRIFLRYLVLTIGIMTVTTILGGQMGLFSGKRPSGLGVQNGQLKPAPSTPNCVSSQATTEYHQIAPFAVQGDPQAAFERVKAVVTAMPAAKIIESKPGYFYAEYTTKLMGYVDDVEFYLDEKSGAIHVRSASRLGIKDLGVNRKRVEAIRAAYSASR